MPHSPSDNEGKVAGIARNVKLMDARIMSRKATKAIDAGRFAEAIELLTQARGSFEFAQEMEGEAEVLSLRAMCFAQMGQFSEAEKDLNASLRLNEEMKDEEGAATDHLLLAKLKLRRKDLAGAKSSATTALALFEKLKLDEERQKASKVLAAIAAA
jgi:tetratricopeptide (TPR) repeat protein